MKKVGILTIVNYDNYGNKLQNYAVEQLVKKNGYQPETIINKREYKKSLIKKLILFTKRIIKICLGYKLNNSILEKNKILRFKDFSKRYLNESNFEIYYNDITKLDQSDYYKVIIGSDQIWNPNFGEKGASDNNFAQFVPKEKRIAFSPSIAVSKIEIEWQSKYKKWMEEIPFLSCREEVGAKLIKNLTGRDTEVLVDPTMVLTKEEWKFFSLPQENKTKKKYILTYYLGDLEEEYERKVKKIAQENNFDIINLCDKNIPDLYMADPREWVDYIANAELFLTDSFHGVVFSILMETPFIVFNRISNHVSMNSRMDTILSKFKFENRKKEEVFDRENYFNIDFNHCEEILKIERKKALNYLKNALDN
ncbi:polysaccharide pyruvyl transferase family protein [Psychrilyobacter sp.]|uniref:polysaccharide pyruvyl transferase family protein n=1 Tax=Psychrilyobacter sp. TaxID=2586924 RepID=UPI0030181A47